MHQAETAEAYDILATEPVSGRHVKIQVKTVRQRHDRAGDLVVYARKGNGTVYEKSDADYIVGVWANDSTTPRVFMFENRGLSEYWCRESRVVDRWVELPIALNRGLSEVLSADVPLGNVA